MERGLQQNRGGGQWSRAGPAPTASSSTSWETFYPEVLVFPRLMSKSSLDFSIPLPLNSQVAELTKWMVPEGKDRGHLYLEKGQWSHRGRESEVGVGFLVASIQNNLGRKEPLARVWTRQWPLLLY